MRKLILAVFAVAMLGIPTASQAGTLGCLVGAAAGGFGGAQIGKGTGRLAAVGLGTLLGCGVGSSIQNSDQQRYQQPQQVYRPPANSQRYDYYSQNRLYTGYVTPSYNYQPQPVYRQPPPQIIWNQPAPVQQPQQTCREFQTQVTVGGQLRPAYGRACYQPDGSWKIVSWRQ